MNENNIVKVPDNVEYISINIGAGHDGTGIGGQISISTTPPADVGAGCTVYVFDSNRLKYIDILVPEIGDDGKLTSVPTRIRSHTEPSPLDRMCVMAILERYEHTPPNEIFCKLEKLNPKEVSSLTVLDKPVDVIEEEAEDE